MNMLNFSQSNLGADEAEDDTYEFIFKIVLLGDAGVGKSNLVYRFTKNDFNFGSKSTIAVEFSTKTVELDDNRSCKAQIWDTSGQERYRSIASSYYRGAVGALVCYDITSKRSFDSVLGWIKEFGKFADEDCLIMVVGTKMDLESKREVSQQDGLDFARENGLAFIETSAKDAVGVDTAFSRIVQEIYKMQIRRQGIGGGVGNNGIVESPLRHVRGETIKLRAEEQLTEDEKLEQTVQRKRCCG